MIVEEKSLCLRFVLLNQLFNGHLCLIDAVYRFQLFITMLSQKGSALTS